MNRDLEHLNLLSIFYYLFAGLDVLGACVVLMIFFAILPLATGAAAEELDEPVVPVIGSVFIITCAVATVLLVSAKAVCLFIAGRSLSRQRHRTFCFVMAALICPSVPLGTILGVFTIIVLSRETVRQLFEERATGRGGRLPQGGYA